MANKDLIAERLKAMNENKETLKQEKPNVVDNIVTGKVEKPDFLKMSEILEAKKKEEECPPSKDEYVKDTIYIRSDLHKAMNALCIHQGDKKMHCNKAYELYLTKIYKEMGGI